MTEDAKKKIGRMYEYFGRAQSPDAICKNCKNLKSYTANRKYYKCRCYGDTSSEATDWRLGWLACGLYNQNYDGKPVVEIRYRKSRKDEPMKGQEELDL